MRTVKWHITLAITLIIFVISGYANANIWIDETFEDGLAFDSSAIDTFDNSPPTTPALTFLSETGTVTTDRCFNDTYSYRLDAGQSLVVGAGAYENASNGPFQYWQFAVSADNIPVGSGVDMAEFRWDWAINGFPYSFYLSFVSDGGGGVDIVAGEDITENVSAIIETLPDSSTWLYITVQINKNSPPDVTDSRTGQTLSQGARFYHSNNDSTPAFEVLLSGTNVAGDDSGQVGFTVTNGTIYLDDIYWEGGMTLYDESSRNLRSFTGPVIPVVCGVLPVDYPVQLVSVGVDPVYENMLLPQAVGWLGSDVGHSIPLSATENLWLFADTFIGTVTAGKRDGGAAFINSSIGIQDMTVSPPGNVDFYWGPGNTSFFPHQAGTGGNLYWPTMGIMLNDELFIYCYNVIFGGPGGFSLPGSTLIRIPNPTDPPGSWIQNAYDLGLGDDMYFHSAVYVEEPYVYFLGSDSSGMVLARALTADIIAGGLGEVYEFWVEGVGGPEWGPTPVNLVPLFSPSNTETDIHYEPGWGLYICTTYNPFTPVIYITVAPALTGPWSEPVCVYEVPEHSVSFDIISYAVRPHPELSTQPGEIIITYETNSFGTVAPLFTVEGLGIYHPRFIRLQLAENPVMAVEDWLKLE